QCCVVFASASTHPVEEAAVIEAHRRLRGTFPQLLTILVPRHPERGMGLAEIASAAGLTATMRSRGHLPDRSIDIYVADTMGELGSIYRLAPVVFMGGSLIAHGGQKPPQPVKPGAPPPPWPPPLDLRPIYFPP